MPRITADEFRETGGTDAAIMTPRCDWPLPSALVTDTLRLSLRDCQSHRSSHRGFWEAVISLSRDNRAVNWSPFCRLAEQADRNHLSDTVTPNSQIVPRGQQIAQGRLANHDILVHVGPWMRSWRAGEAHNAIPDRWVPRRKPQPYRTQSTHLIQTNNDATCVSKSVIDPLADDVGERRRTLGPWRDGAQTPGGLATPWFARNGSPNGTLPQPMSFWHSKPPAQFRGCR
jgi:hypothetical protein